MIDTFMDSRSLLNTYLVVSAWFLVIVWACWLVGLEGIYGHPLPFYGLVFLSFETHSLLWMIPAVVAAGVGFAGLRWLVRGRDWEAFGESARAQWLYVGGLVVFAALFAATVAMIRGGWGGISEGL